MPEHAASRKQRRPDPPHRHRQRRGLERIELILEAATRVVAEVGYERTTTNAIAARAGISPGSLYQYFSSKEDIASALWERYAERLSAIISDESLISPDMPAEEVVDHIVDPVHALKTANRDFAQLYGCTSTSGLGAVAQAHSDFQQGLVAILAARNPRAPRTELTDVAAILSAMFSATLTRETVTGDSAKDLTEIKRAMLAYLSSRGLG